jgi:hypothetical protein
MVTQPESLVSPLEQAHAECESLGESEEALEGGEVFAAPRIEMPSVSEGQSGLVINGGFNGQVGAGILRLQCAHGNGDGVRVDDGTDQ